MTSGPWSPGRHLAGTSGKATSDRKTRCRQNSTSSLSGPILKPGWVSISVISEVPLLQSHGDRTATGDSSDLPSELRPELLQMLGGLACEGPPPDLYVGLSVLPFLLALNPSLTRHSVPCHTFSGYVPLPSLRGTGGFQGHTPHSCNFTFTATDLTPCLDLHKVLFPRS